jgi:hypothetical protein
MEKTTLLFFFNGRLGETSIFPLDITYHGCPRIPGIPLIR